MVDPRISLTKITGFDEKFIGIYTLTSGLDEIQGRNPKVRMSMRDMVPRLLAEVSKSDRFWYSKRPAPTGEAILKYILLHGVNPQRLIS